MGAIGGGGGANVGLPLTTSGATADYAALNYFDARRHCVELFPCMKKDRKRTGRPRKTALDVRPFSRDVPSE